MRAQVIQAEPVVRMFDILRKEGCGYVTQADLKSMMAGILLSHPGLEFLQETPEFQDRCPQIMHQIDNNIMTSPVAASCWKTGSPTSKNLFWDVGPYSRLTAATCSTDGCAQVCGDCDLPHLLRLGSVRDRDAVAAGTQAVRLGLSALVL